MHNNKDKNTRSSQGMDDKPLFIKLTLYMLLLFRRYKSVGHFTSRMHFIVANDYGGPRWICLITEGSLIPMLDSLTRLIVLQRQPSPRGTTKTLFLL